MTSEADFLNCSCFTARYWVNGPGPICSSYIEYDPGNSEVEFLCDDCGHMEECHQIQPTKLHCVDLTYRRPEFCLHCALKLTE
jgi:hypothetical protein